MSPLRRHYRLVSCVLTVLIVGCGSDKKMSGPMAMQADAIVAERKPVAAGAANAPAANPQQQPIDRKIIYTSTLEMIVKDLDESIQLVDQKLKSHKARLVKSEVRSDPGARRTGSFTLEVPVDLFRDLVAGLKELGTVSRDTVDSQDVTEEFVDIQARIKNLRQQEDKLNELLRDKRKEEKLEDILRVSEKVYEVRQQIERIEGRMKYLEARAAFSTVNLTLREVKDYKPPTTPTFGTRIGTAFTDSWGSVAEFLEQAALFGVSLVPWLPLLVPIGLVTLRLARSFKRRILASWAGPTGTSHGRGPRA